MPRLFLLLLIMPFVELYLLIQLHRHWASLWGHSEAWLITLGSIFLAALAGVSLAKRQGLRLFTQAQEQLREGQLPSQTMLEGLLMLAGAAALILPGYVSDVVGIVLLIPWTRRQLVKTLRTWLGHQVEQGHIRVYPTGSWQTRGPMIQDQSSGEIIDVEPIQKS